MTGQIPGQAAVLTTEATCPVGRIRPEAAEQMPEEERAVLSNDVGSRVQRG